MHLVSIVESNANEKSSNHAGFWIFLFCPSPGFCPRFGLFFPKVRKELCAIFRFLALFCGSIPPASEVVGLRQRDPVHHRLRRGKLRRVIQMGVDVRRGRKVAVPQPLLNLLERYAVGQQERSTGVPQIVKPHPRQAVLLHEIRERDGQPVWLDPVAHATFKGICRKNVLTRRRKSLKNVFYSP